MALALGSGVDVSVGVAVGVTGVLVGMGKGVLVACRVGCGVMGVVVGTAVGGGGVKVRGKIAGISATAARVGKMMTADSRTQPASSIPKVKISSPALKALTLLILIMKIHLAILP